MKKLLITGFEPFGGETLNPSWEAISLLPDVIGDFALTKLQIPVVFKKAPELVIQTANSLCPDVILCIGEAGGRTSVTPEFVGINLRHASIPDNEGKQPQDEPIIKKGENAYFSTLPVRKIAQAIHLAGIPSQVSYSAGAYVCNDTLYSLLAHYHGSDTRVGFIHVPYCTLQNKTPSMELDTIVKGLQTAINAL